VRVRPDVSVIAAFIVPRTGAGPEIREIEQFVADRLAPYKRPRAYLFVETLPRTANGKLMRSQLMLPEGLSTGS